MTHEHGRMVRHELDDTLVASLRFRGQREDTAPAMQRLRHIVGSDAAGPGIVITHDVNPDTGRDIEVCIPVKRRITADGITCRVLPGGPWLAITHVGPQDFDDAEYGIMATVGQLVAYIREHNVGIAEDPTRIVWVEGPEIHGADEARYVTEVQTPLLLPRWVARMRQGLEHYAGLEVRDAVLADDPIDIDSDPRRKVAWAQGVMQRLDAAVPDMPTRCRIMNHCAHRFPQEHIDRAHAKFQELGTIDDLVNFMQNDTGFYGGSAYSQPVRDGNRVIVTKKPANPAAYEAATDPREKRAAACFCRMIHAAYMDEETLSETWCHCSAGWYARLWSGILEQDVRVEVLQTILQGSEKCQFAVHIPDGVPLSAE